MGNLLLIGCYIGIYNHYIYGAKAFSLFEKVFFLLVSYKADVQGIEPQTVGLEPIMMPLHHTPI